MLRFLHDEDIWQEMRSLSRKRKIPLYIAVPYLGDGSGKLLYLGHGDVLVVALTEANSRNGSVCPKEIERLQAKGVRVFLSPYLHAKVLLCGRNAVVGSANLSETSYARLDEAAILTNDVTIGKHIREWFQQRMYEPVTPEWLRICAKAYKPPRTGTMRVGKRKVRRAAGGVWLMNLRPSEHPDDEAAIAKRGAAEAESELSDPSQFKVIPVRWAGNAPFRKGDTVIQVMRTNRDSRYVEELARLIGIRRTKSRRGTAVTYVYLECRRRPKRFTWKQFKRQCRTVGLKLGKSSGTRELTKPAQANKVLAFVSRRQ